MQLCYFFPIFLVFAGLQPANGADCYQNPYVYGGKDKEFVIQDMCTSRDGEMVLVGKYSEDP
jgi:hypothetical protein